MKTRHLKIFLLIAVAVICMTSFCSCFDFDDMVVDLGIHEFFNQKKKVNNEFTVIFRTCEGVSLDPDEDEVKSVKSGSDAEFEVTISENYIYLGNTVGAEYDAKNGRVVLEDVQAPTTIDLILIAKSELYCVEVNKNHDSGIVLFEKGGAWSVDPGEITLKAVSPNGYVFRGWSSGNYLVNNGVLLSKDEVYTFTQTQDIKMTRIYANFESENEYRISYDPNGGAINNAGDRYTIVKEYSDNFMLQQTLHEGNDVAKFTRDGFQLVGYSTEPTTTYADYTSANAITGFSNLGGVCEVPKDEGALTLYAVWAQNTNDEAFVTEIATYTDIWATRKNKNENSTTNDISQTNVTGVVIKGYRPNYNTGSLDTIVIPEYIDGKPVIGIASRAFDNIISIKKVVIPKTVLKIESGAFSNASGLDEVVFFDSLQYVYNDSFSSRVSTIVLNSQKLPAYGGSAEGSFCIKYERVRYFRDSKKIVVVSGSSSLNGLNSKMLKENFNDEYEIINYGTNAGTQALFYLDVISNYVTDGDIIVHAPEWTSGGQMGDSEIQWKLFRGNNQCYDIFREVDMSEYTNFWSSYLQTNIGKLLYDLDNQTYKKFKDNCDFAMFKVGKPTYQDENIGMNKYGDLLGDRNSNRDNWSDSMMFNNQMNSSRAANLNRVNSRIVAEGGIMLFSFGTADAVSVARKDAAWKSKADDFTQICEDLLDYPVISNIGTYIMGENDSSVSQSKQEMYNSAWHCTYYGANVRTVELTYDIKQYFEKNTDSWESYSVRETHRNRSAYKTYNYADWND